MNTDEFRVIKILNTKQIIVNAGSINDVKVGTKFQILDKIGSEPIIDPVTNEDLGRLDITKATLVATSVYTRMSILESESKYHTNINFASKYLTNQSINESLNVDLSEISGCVSTKSDLPIQVGDKAKIVG